MPSSDGSGPLLDADQDARGIADGAVANPPRLLGRLRDDLGSGGLQPFEEAVEVGGRQDDGRVGALAHHLGHDAVGINPESQRNTVIAVGRNRVVVLAQRGKLGKVQDAGLEGADWKLVFALRVASLILRSRSDAKLPFLRVAADAGGFAIDLPQSWLDDNPLSADALEAEARHWKTVGMKLEVNGLSDKKVSVLQQVR